MVPRCRGWVLPAELLCLCFTPLPLIPRPRTVPQSAQHCPPVRPALSAQSAPRSAPVHRLLPLTRALASAASCASYNFSFLSPQGFGSAAQGPSAPFWSGTAAAARRGGGGGRSPAGPGHGLHSSRLPHGLSRPAQLLCLGAARGALGTRWGADPGPREAAAPAPACGLCSVPLPGLCCGHSAYAFWGWAELAQGLRSLCGRTCSCPQGNVPWPPGVS